MVQQVVNDIPKCFLKILEHGGVRYVQDVANVSQNVRDMQRALLDLALLTEASWSWGYWLYGPSLKMESHSKRSKRRKIETYLMFKEWKKHVYDLVFKEEVFFQSLNYSQSVVSPGAR